MIKKYIYILIAIITLQQMKQVSFAAFGEEKIIDELKGSIKPLDQSIESFIAYIFTFLYLLAVLYGLYGGFLILTAAEDDDKVGKGRKIIIQAIIGLIVIFLAGPIATFLLGGNGDAGILVN